MRTRSITLLGLALTLAVGPPAGAEDPAPKAGSPPTASVYKLPKVGKPTGRLGGGRRGGALGAQNFYALVTDHVGYTVSEQPTLYWYLSSPAAGPVKFEITLIDAGSVDPLVDAGFAAPGKPGLQRIDLAKHGVKLAMGEEYQWSIAVVTDPSDRSKDIVSSGWIERVAEPKGLEERIASAHPGDAASLYGAEGLWYDTLDAAVDDTLRNPEDASSRARLAALLTDVGLPGEAAGR